MTTPITRAAQNHNVMAVLERRKMVSKPKPIKEKKQKKAKVMPKRKMLEAQIEAISKLIVFWRDGQQCIEVEIDGVRCGGGNQWGHYIPRQQSHWLKYDLGNTFCQCRNHNNLHDKGSQTMGAWFSLTFGADTALAMEQVRNAHRGEKKMTVQDLEELLAHFDDLYQNRYTVNLDLRSLIAAGYYGSIIKGCFA